MSQDPQHIRLFEQRFAYRVREYVNGGRANNSEFSLSGLRGWMLAQNWPEPALSQRIHWLAVLSWSAIRQAEADPSREPEIRRDLGRQLAFLDGTSPNQPQSLAPLLAEHKQAEIYADLHEAAQPGSAVRSSLGLPRFNVEDKR